MVQSQGPPRLRIGAVARSSGVSVDTVRLYERRGLLPPADRLPSGYRSYPPSTVDRIRLTRRLQQVGLTLEEIAAALRAHDGGGGCAAERWRLETVADRLDARIAELQTLRRRLRAVIDDCADGRCALTPAAETGRPDR